MKPQMANNFRYCALVSVGIVLAFRRLIQKRTTWANMSLHLIPAQTIGAQLSGFVCAELHVCAFTPVSNPKHTIYAKLTNT